MWKNVDTVIYYTHADFKFLPTIAIFSFIGTIVKRVIPDSGKTLNSHTYNDGTSN